MNEKHSNQEYLSRFRGAVYMVTALLIIILIVAVPVALGRLNLSWAAPIAGFLLLLALLLLNLRSESIARVSQHLRLYLLIPSLKEVIDHQKELQLCRAIVKRMEYTLSFYNLKIFLIQDIGGAADNESGDGLFDRLRAHLRWDKLAKVLESDPQAQAPGLPDDIAQALVKVMVEEERIERCAEMVADCLSSHHLGVTTISQPAVMPPRNNGTVEPWLAYGKLVNEAKAVLLGLSKSVWSPLLELLYREHNSQQKKTVWTEVKEDERTVQALVAVLLWSGKLPQPEIDLPYSCDSLKDLVSGLDPFTLDEARKKALAEQQRRREKRQVVEGMKYVLDYYDLYRHLMNTRAANLGPEGYDLDPVFRRELIDDPAFCPEEADRIQECAKRLSEKASKSRPSMKSQHLELLYLERHSSSQIATELWNKEAKDANFILELADILLESGKLPDKEDNVAYEKEEVKELINPSGQFKLDFSLDNVRKVLLDDGRRRSENRLIVNNLNHTLRFYKIDSLSKSYQDSLTASLRGKSIEARQEDCAQQVSNLLQSRDPRVSTALLHLLYLERHAPPQEATKVWNKEAQDENFILDLADILIDSGKLPEKEDKVAYEKEVVQELINPSSQFKLDFSLDNVRKVLLKDGRRRYENHLIVKNMDHTLCFYKIGNLSDDFQEELTDSLQGESTEARQEDCAQKVSNWLQARDPRVSFALLLLLFLERHAPSREATQVWNREAQDVNFFLDLADILLDSGELPDKEDNVAYKKEEVQDLLKSSGQLKLDFSLDNVRKVLLDDGRRRYENRLIVKNMDHTLRFYKNDHLSKSYQDRLAGSLQGNSKDARQIDCAQKVSTRLQVREPKVSTDLLHLLYLERHEQPQKARTAWNNLKSVQGFSISLADVLLESTRIPEIDKDLPLKAKVLGDLLQNLNDFSLDQASNVVLADQEWQRANRAVIDGLLEALDHFCLNPLLKHDPDKLHRRLIDNGYKSRDGDMRLEYYAGELAKSVDINKLADWANLEDGQVAKSVRNVSNPVAGRALKLLYLEHWRKNRDKELCWRDGKQEKGFTMLLASFLVYSTLLPHGQEYVPYGISHLQNVLSRLPSISTLQISAELAKLNEVWQRSHKYREFLIENRIGDWQPQVDQVLQRVKIPGDSDQLDRDTQEVLIWIGVKAIEKAFPELEDVFIEEKSKALHLTDIGKEHEEYQDLLRALSMISLIIFITEKSTGSLVLREKVCHQAAAMRKSPYIVIGYLEFREQLRRKDEAPGKEFLDIAYLVKNWAKKAKERRDKLGRGFEEEIETIREFMRKGEWLRRLPSMLDKTYQNILKKNVIMRKKLEAEMEQRPAIRKPLETVFKELSINTIARFLESKKRTAYLLTFRVGGGTVAELLECLGSPNARERRQLQELGITLQVINEEKMEIESKYNFKQYTPSARIGIVPTNWSFDRFFKAFQEDFSVVIDNAAKFLPPKKLKEEEEDEEKVLKNIEIIVSHFDLSGGGQHWFEYKGLTQQRAKKRVRELFAGVLSEKELMMLIQYEGFAEEADEQNLSEAIMVLPITDLVGKQLQLRPLEREVLDREDLRLKKELTVLHSCENIRQLGRVIGGDPRERMRAARTLSMLLESVLDFDKESRRKNIARIYTMTLAAVGRISN